MGDEYLLQYPPLKGFYTCQVIRDLFANSIIAYKTSRQQTVNLALGTSMSCCTKRDGRGELHLHSD